MIEAERLAWEIAVDFLPAHTIPSQHQRAELSRAITRAVEKGMAQEREACAEIPRAAAIEHFPNLAGCCDRTLRAIAEQIAARA